MMMCDQCYPEWAEWLDYRGVHTVQLQHIGPPSAGMLPHLEGDRLVPTTGRRVDIRDTITRQQDLIVSLCQRTPRPHRWVPNGRSRRITEAPA